MNGMGRRGQTANPSTLLAIITLVIVLYIIFIPPSFRKQLLNENSTDTNSDVSGYDKVLLKKEPGFWSYNDLKNMEHDLNSFNLISKSEAKAIAEAKVVKAKSTAFSKETGKFSFNVLDSKKTENFYINFKVSSQSGKATVYVNGNVIKEFTEESQEHSVAIDKNYIKDGENTVEFKSERVGFAFWKANNIDISLATVYADIIDDSGLYSTQRIWISKDELKNIDDAYMKYFVDCQIAQAKKVDVALNGVLIFSGIPDCGVLNSINHISPSILREGDNKIEFQATGGRYLYDSMVFKTLLKESEFPTYYFNVEEEDYKKLQTGLIELNLTFTFVNDRDYKEIEAIINGHGIGISTYDRVYNAPVNYQDIKLGNNVLELVPKSSISIAEVKLRGVFD
jgi:hypothetical protein